MLTQVYTFLNALQEPGDQYSHLAPRNMSSPYDHLRNILNDTDSVIEDPYPDLRQLLPVDMVTFAYQIADGMVSILLWNDGGQ